MGKWDKPGSDWHKLTIYTDGPSDVAIINALVHLKSLSSNDEYWATSGSEGFATIPNVHKRVTSCLIEITHPDYEDLSIVTLMSKDVYQLVYLLKVKPPKPEPEPWDTVTIDQLKQVKGNFCGMIIPGIGPLNNDLVYTPAYLSYDNDKRALIRSAYKDRGYTHMPIVPYNGKIYGSYFPDINLSLEERRRRIKELWYDGIIPMAAAMQDWEDRPSDDFYRLTDLIKFWWPKWEINEIDENDTDKMCGDFEIIAESIKYGSIFACHFGPKHSSGVGTTPFYFCPVDGERFKDENHFCAKHNKFALPVAAGRADANGMWHTWFKAIGGDGILVQCDIDDDVNASSELVNDFTSRLGPGAGAWPSGMFVWAFEIRARRSFHTTEPESVQVDFCNEMRRYNYQGKDVDGWMNG